MDKYSLFVIPHLIKSLSPYYFAMQFVDILETEPGYLRCCQLRNIEAKGDDGNSDQIQ